VTLQQELPTIVFYGVRNTSPEAEGALAYGSISVPPISRPPYLRPDLDPIRAEAGQEVIIRLDEFVAVARGREGAFLFEPGESGNLTARHAEVKTAEGGAAISYTADKKYQGEDLIEFWVADTGDSGDKTLKRSKLWLDVVVAPKGQVALAFKDPGPQVERGGGSRTLDLADFVTGDGRPLASPGKLAVDLGRPNLAGLTVDQSGTKVTASAGVAAQVGDRALLPLTISYDGGDPKAGLTLTVTVVDTKQPAVKPKVASPVKVVKGEPHTVPVLQGVFDPWAKEKPAAIKNVRATAGAQAAAAGQSIVVTAAEANQTVVVSFEVEDALGRVQPGSFEAVPRAEPDAPDSVRADPGDKGTATVTWTPVTGTHENGEKVDGYKVAFTDAPGASCPAAAPPANSVKCSMGSTEYGKTLHVQVTAHNAIGDSKPGTGEFLYEIVPDPPAPKTAEAGLGLVDLAWAPAAAGTGTVASYSVTCGGSVHAGLPAASTTLTVTGLTPATAYVCTITATNAKGNSAAVPFPSATPWGQPGALDTPAVSRVSGSQVEVAWTTPDDLGAGMKYSVYKNGAKISRCHTSPCAASLAVGESAEFQVKGESSKKGVENVSSPSTPLYTQWPDSVPSVPGFSASGSGNSAAGQGYISVYWPSIPSVTGHQSSPTYVDHNGASYGYPPDDPTGLRAGDNYSFAVSYCVSPSQGTWVPPAPAAICSDPRTATASVTTKPAPPTGCSATRLDGSTAQLADCQIPDSGGVTARIQYKDSGTWRDLPDDWVVGVTGGNGGGTVEVRSKSSIGESGEAGVPYGEWSPPPTPTPDPPETEDPPDGGESPSSGATPEATPRLAGHLVAASPNARAGAGPTHGIGQQNASGVFPLARGMQGFPWASPPRPVCRG
jgi:hypothetical protein